MEAEQLPLPWDIPNPKQNRRQLATSPTLPERITSLSTDKVIIAPTSVTSDITLLKDEAARCTRCGLRGGCRQVVFADGCSMSDLMLVGEGPGEQEDIQGKPFVGKAGQLLDRILAAIGLDRMKVYIANVVKCRPPGNRTPTPEECQTCAPWLHRQIEIVKPRIIVCLGATATKSLIDPEARISRIRGHWVDRHHIRFMPTYHPAALLRNPGLKKDAWEDFQKVRKVLDAMGADMRKEEITQMAKEQYK